MEDNARDNLRLRRICITCLDLLDIIEGLGPEARRQLIEKNSLVKSAREIMRRKK